jgi:hypothetical protein
VGQHRLAALGGEGVGVGLVHAQQAGSELAWWQTFNINAMPAARKLWEQTHPDEGQIQTTIDQAETVAKN